MSRSYRCVLSLLLVAAGALLVDAQPASADGCTTAASSGRRQKGVEVDVQLVCPGGPSPGAPPTPRTPAERWRQLRCNSFTGQAYRPPAPEVPATDVSPARPAIPGATALGPNYIGAIDTAEELAAYGYDPTGEYAKYLVVCTPAGDAATSSRVTVVYETAPPVPIEDLLAQARRTLDPPDPQVQSSPPLDRLRTLVQIETWLWVDPVTTYDSEPATAGFVTVTAHAEYGGTTFDMGDGTTIDCATPGTPWSKRAERRGGDCFHIYTRSSGKQPGQKYQGSATTTWNYWWAINGVAQGDLDPEAKVATFEAQVHQVQAVGTG